MYKICFITTVSLTLNAFVRNLADYLHESGKFEIYFICDNDESFASSLPEYINYIPVSMKRGISFDGFKAMLQLKSIFKKHQFDIIQYSTPNASCYAAIAGYLAKVPVRLYCQWGIAYVGFSGLKRKIFKLIEKMVCTLSTWVEPDSNSNLDFSHAENLYPKEKGSVVWNGSASGVNLEKFDIDQKEKWRDEIRAKYEISENAIVYIFIGRITGDKGINELLYATKKLLEDNENVYLLMVGGNEVNTDVDNSLYEWSINESRVIYTGFTNEVEKYLSASDVYVLPSYREGFGSAVIEAEAMGVPVIVTNIPGPVDAMIDGDTGVLTPKANAEKLYEKMLLMYDNKELREQYGYNGERFVRTSFEQKALFERILNDRCGLINRNYN